MDYKLKWKTIWIDQSKDLEEMLSKLEQEEIISVDTETSGWQTGNEQLCLIQIGAPKNEEIYLIDALGCDGWEVIAPILESGKPSVIAHNASFEQRQFARHDIKMRGVIDTLKMAKSLRADLPNRTLKTCCKMILDIEMSKEQQVSDWSVRPLTPEQVHYAALDAEVTYLLYEALAAMEAELTLDNALDVPELMAELHQAEKRYFELIKDIAAEMELIKLRKDMLKDAIRSKLIDGSEPYEGEHGSAKIQQVKRTEIIPEKVRDLMPEVAELAIVESVQRTRLKDLIEEHNIDKDLLDEVTELLRYDNRLVLKIGDL